MKASVYSPAYDQLRSWLKNQREQRGLSLRATAKIMGRHHSVLGKMEQDRKIDLVEFVEYCLALGADPHEGLKILTNCLNREEMKERR
ncbi:helix-turn-helix transcriptional regulator [Microbulbifer sp. 2205BS26-8]|uniref:helix-turn-helix domain-containing protein n=1 Tax=Microbulbifer sp. 2205BS26-8 TaxID=3064386 RepID=UPI00273F69B3|nr:helix-turn-helix transcriptional regulator [Microbulbifer sp. 2205BS26-8]MDP5208835.1 helix-turn-helix transcriptional regulator [Microbulbifer sp. 2205BS26-8]